MRKTTLANLETKTLKAFRNISPTTRMRMQRFLIGCHTFRSNFTRKCGYEFIASSIRKQVDNWQDMDVLTVLDVFIEPNAAALVDGNSLVTALENIELVPAESLEHQLSTI